MLPSFRRRFSGEDRGLSADINGGAGHDERFPGMYTRCWQNIFVKVESFEAR